MATGEVPVRGIVYEVARGDKTGSVFGFLANLLGGKLNISIGTVAGSLDNFIQLKNTALDAVFSMLEMDIRYKVLSLPSLRIQSGARGVFSVGPEVPVLGTLFYRVYRELELNLRIKPSKRLLREKPEPLTVPENCNAVWYEHA
ncbi:hypothetical protein CtesDRAFT_PD2036 [Comamonas testosteroni KF-1]|uniref:Uncharacterized protein n=1 Tax=Comamonas testosteroni (strain DSM 14576 / KF-1) TaxID=399795 RepID=B7WQU5_COMTK|nr:hypothetical protein CtesDRAFT_PD2036 [Comamonas testosteroni KF-1]